MNAKTPLLLLVLTVSATAAFAADDAKAIVGVWRYGSEVDTRADGSPAPGSALSKSQGLLIYTADGFMSVIHMPEGRHWKVDSATVDEFRETVNNGTAYAGRYELDTAKHTVTHITSVSVEPEYQGKRLMRKYSLEGDTLKLSGTFAYQGETISFVITWVRVPGPQAEWKRPDK